MLTKRSKRFMAVLFTTIMTIGSTTSAFASEANPVGSDVVMLSNYNTPYTTTITADPAKAQQVDLKVTGLDGSYNRVPLSEQQANDVTWSVKDGGTITPGAISKGKELNGAGYAATAKVTIPATDSYGYAVVEAELPSLAEGNRTLDLAIVVNPAAETTVTPVRNITVNFVSGNETVTKTIRVLGENTDTSTLETKYPTALSAILALQADPKSGISDVVIGNGYLSSLKINNVVYPSTDTGYWMYSVKNGQTVYPLSAIVGAGDFQLHNNDVITWTCTQ